jgi:hypothetical protein
MAVTKVDAAKEMPGNGITPARLPLIRMDEKVKVKVERNFHPKIRRIQDGKHQEQWQPAY